MSDSTEAQVPESAPASTETDRTTRLLWWAVITAVLTLVSVIAYGYLAGALETAPPRTAEEDAIASTAEAIAKNPSDGKQYAIRAEALHSTGSRTEAFQVLDQGEKAVAGKNPALLYILRTRTALLNDEGRFSEAAEVGLKAMDASDAYLTQQAQTLAQKGVTAISGNRDTRASVDTALLVAEAYTGLKQYAKAAETYDYALLLEPTAADILSMRGWAYLEAGDKAKAKADFEATLKYLPDDEYAVRGMKELSR
jgi:tetratricopeptide (TPR) repeat protein